jgi:hypothetical protein
VTTANYDGPALKTSCWNRTLDTFVIQADVADLDGDGFNEVIAATGEAIHVFNSSGQPLWSRNLKAPIRKFVVGGEYIAVLSRAHLTIFDSTGEPRGREPAGMLHEVVFDRPTSHHDRKIIVAGIEDGVVVLAKVHPKTGAIEWRRAILPPGQFIEKLEIRDADNDARRDISIVTTKGTATVNFDGEVVTMDGVQVVPIHKSRLSVSSNQ